MSVRDKLGLLALTLVYLVLELSFNAKLLDVVGTASVPSKTESLEVFGRILSGIAAALFALKYLLEKRVANPARFDSRVIFGICASIVIVVYFSLKLFVDAVVYDQDAAFRKNAMTMTLVQKALLTDEFKLEGFVEDQSVFKQPSGKAFIAILPFLGATIPDLDSRVEALKPKLLRQRVEEQLGPPDGIYEKYRSAISEVSKTLKSKRASYDKMEEKVGSAAEAIVNEYLADLRKRGWSPSTIPYDAVPAIRGEMLRKVPRLPVSWSPTDLNTLYEVIYEEQLNTARQKINAQDRDALDMSLAEFVRRSDVQNGLRKNLQARSGASVVIPSGLVFQSKYASADDFVRQVYEPIVAENVARLQKVYRSSVSDFELGGKHYEAGIDSVKLTLVPPIAMLFSLLGGLTHMVKLLHLIRGFLPAKLLPANISLAKFVPNKGLQPNRLTTRVGNLILSPRVWRMVLKPLPLAMAGIVAISFVDADVTKTRVYVNLRENVTKTEGMADYLKAQLVARSVHSAVVGQSLLYPSNNFLRQNLLFGFDFLSG